MKLFFRETGVIETLAIIDPRTGCDYIFDFMGNTGAFTREFEKTDENADFAISQADYDWWAKVVADNQALENRIAELAAEHGYDRVMDVVISISCDLAANAAPAGNTATPPTDCNTPRGRGKNGKAGMQRLSATNPHSG